MDFLCMSVYIIIPDILTQSLDIGLPRSMLTVPTPDIQQLTNTGGIFSSK